MSIKDQIKKEIDKCIQEIIVILDKFPKDTSFSFHLEYQNWYTKALKIVQYLAPDRYDEFKSFYEINSKRKSIGYGSYVIQDYIKGVAPSRISYPDFNTKDQTLRNVFNQYSIIFSLNSRIDSILSDLQSAIYIEIQDNELSAAQNLIKTNLRAAGALAGVILEGYLQKVAENHKIKISKKNPSINDLNEPLKNGNIYDTVTWRKISYLGDLRNLCSHKKDKEPTIDEVNDLINGVNWVSKNVF